MPFRRTFVATAIAFALAGTMLPTSPEAQIGYPATAPSDSQPHRAPDVGWVGLLGLVGLFGLFGSRKADRTMS
jgi:MYXO-CTERM domain-containing protein